MKRKVVLALAIVLIPAFIIMMAHKNTRNVPPDLRDAPNSGKAFEELKDAAPAKSEKKEALPAPAAPVPHVYHSVSVPDFRAKFEPALGKALILQGSLPKQDSMPGGKSILKSVTLEYTSQADVKECTHRERDSAHDWGLEGIFTLPTGWSRAPNHNTVKIQPEFGETNYKARLPLAQSGAPCYYLLDRVILDLSVMTDKGEASYKPTVVVRPYDFFAPIDDQAAQRRNITEAVNVYCTGGNKMGCRTQGAPNDFFTDYAQGTQYYQGYKKIEDLDSKIFTFNIN